MEDIKKEIFDKGINEKIRYGIVKENIDFMFKVFGEKVITERIKFIVENDIAASVEVGVHESEGIISFVVCVSEIGGGYVYQTIKGPTNINLK